MRGAQQQRQQQRQGPDPAQISANRNTLARITPNVLGASQGGQGTTPDRDWAKMFPVGPSADRVAAARSSWLPNGAQGAGRAAGTAPGRSPLGSEGVSNPPPIRGAMGGPGRTITPNASQTAALDAASGVVNPSDTVRPLVNAAGKPVGGNTLASTQFGSGYSRIAARGEPLAPAPQSATGVTRDSGDFHQQIMRQYPQIGVKDSPENKAYVAAYTDKLKQNPSGNFDQVQLAHDVMGKMQGEQLASAAKGGAQAGAQAAAQKSAQDQAPIIAGQKAGAADAAAAAAKADAARTFAPGTVLGAGETAIKAVPDIADKVEGAMENFGRNALGYVATPDDANSTMKPKPPVPQIRAGLAQAKDMQAHGFGTPGYGDQEVAPGRVSDPTGGTKYIDPNMATTLANQSYYNVQHQMQVQGDNWTPPLTAREQASGAQPKTLAEMQAAPSAPATSAPPPPGTPQATQSGATPDGQKTSSTTSPTDFHSQLASNFTSQGVHPAFAETMAGLVSGKYGNSTSDNSGASASSSPDWSPPAQAGASVASNQSSWMPQQSNTPAVMSPATGGANSQPQEEA